MNDSSKAVNPPKFGGDKTYERWKVELDAWKLVTKVEKKSQALTIALSFEESSEVRDKVFSEIKIEELHNDDGLKKLIECLDKWYKKDELSEAYESWNNFYKFKKSEDTSMDAYILEFVKRYKIVKKFKIEIPSSVLAFILLECTGLEHRDKQLVLTAVDYSEPNNLLDQMSAAIKKFFGAQGASAKYGEEATSSISVKSEPVYTMQEVNILNKNKRSDFNRGKANFNSGNYRKGTGNYRKNSDFKGNSYKCFECGSPNHFRNSCPRRIYEMRSDTKYEDKSDSECYISECYITTGEADKCKMVGDSLNCAVLDTACSSTVCGLDWLNCFLDTLTDHDIKKVVVENSNMNFKFGDGSIIKSLKRVVFPAILAGYRCRIKTDVIDTDIPLLFGKPSMKKAGVKIDLKTDSAIILGKHVDLSCTASGHYCIPISDFKGGNQHIHQVLMMEGNCTAWKDIEKQVMKLHKQFGHPSSRKLIQLMKDAGIMNEHYFQLVNQISETCDICQKFKRSPSKPVVSMPMAREFNETVAMDLKEWKKGEVYILHLIDMATRFSRSAVIYNKNKKTIIDKFMEIWIGTGIGCPEKVLCDNGGEFANSEFMDMCENLNIRVISTAAESPFSNGLCERNHAVIDETVNKILADQANCSLQVAVSWAVNAKNCLQMVGGYSPYQLVFGRNPRLPNVLNDYPPALEGTTVSEIFAFHLNIMHAARQAFMRAEASEKIRRALRYQVRPVGNIFECNDLVYYKKDNCREWKGPGTVIGQDGSVIIIRHGSFINRVHSTRVMKKKMNLEFESEKKALLNFLREFFNQPLNELKNNFPCAETEESQISGSKSDLSPAIVSDDLTPTDAITLPDNNENVDTSTSSDNFVRLKDNIPKVGHRIKYVTNDSNEWNRATVLSRAGKATGQYSKWLNIHPDNEEARAMDFGLAVREWEYITDNNSDNMEQDNMEQETFVGSSKEDDVLNAKTLELENWKKFDVFEEVENQGQTALSVRWVCTEKMIDGKIKTKARLVARGFEEVQKAQSDSPTGNKDTLRIFLAIISSRGWSCRSIDIKAAFLQGEKFDRQVFLKPPKEANAVSGSLWKLKKCVYGLNDAARVWYMTGRNFLLSVGCRQLKTDPAGFYWYYKGTLEGVFLMHVDDYFWGGTSNFEAMVISKLCNKFMVGQESSEVFKYIGLEISKNEDGITVSQNGYKDSVQVIQIFAGRANQKTSPCNEAEIEKYRGLVGKINWLSTQSRPDISYEALELSCNMSHPKIEHILQANKCLKKVGMTETFLQFPNLGNLKNVRLVSLSDASHANLPDGYSSAGGFIIFLVGENGKCCPLAWESKKIRRVVKSTLAAETLAMSDAIDVCYYLGYMLSEILFGFKGGNAIPITSYVDNKSLFENVYSTKNVSEKRLRIDLASIKELADEGHVDVKWIESSRQLADCLTKKGAKAFPLMEILENGVFNV